MKKILVALLVAISSVAHAQLGPIVPYSSQTPTFAISTGTLAAAGTTQATAAAITASDTTVTSATTGSAYGVLLPATVGVPYTLRNRTGIALSVYPPGTGTIETGAASAAVLVPANANAVFISSTAGQWRYDLSQETPQPIGSELVPAIHLAKMVASSSPNICVVGDSTTTTSANNLVPNDLLYYGLTRRLREDNPTKTFNFLNYAISGQTWNTLDSTASANFPAWYFDTTLPWLPYVQALNCTSVFLNFGVNDSYNFAPSQPQAVLSKIVAWGTAPSGWAASTAYTAGTVIEDSNSKLEIVKTGGTSGSGAHPSWPSTVGASTTDGSVIWELLSATAYVPSVPDLVLITNKNLNPASAAAYGNAAWSTGTIAAASYQRTMALGGATPTTFSITGLPPLGLIDVGRMFTEVFDGYDPVNPYFVQSITTPTAAITSFPYTLPQTAGGDFDVTFAVANGSSYNSSTFIEVTTGGDSIVSSLVYLVPAGTGVTTYVNNYAVAGIGSVSTYASGVWTTGTNTIEVTAKGTHLLVQVNGTIVVDVLTARFVSPFTPIINLLTPPSSPSIVVNSYNVSVPRPVTPIVGGTECFGLIGGAGPTGGNGTVHDASQCINAVDMMVLDSIRFNVPPHSAQQVFTSSGTFTILAGSTMVCHLDVGGGGGGGGGGVIPAGGSGSGGGGGGAGTVQGPFCKPASSYGSSVAVTVGAAGTGGASASNGGSGGYSQFGSDTPAYGGGGGGSGGSGRASAGGGGSGTSTPAASSGATPATAAGYGSTGIAAGEGAQGTNYYSPVYFGGSGSGTSATGTAYPFTGGSSPSAGASGGGFSSGTPQQGGYTVSPAGYVSQGTANSSGVGGVGSVGMNAFPFSSYDTLSGSGGGAGTTTGGAAGACPTGGAGAGGSGGGAGETAGGAGAAGCPGAVMAWQY